MSEELKKCPACGGVGEIRQTPKLYEGQKFVDCLNPDCYVMMILEDWQSRPLEDALQRKLDIAIGALKLYDGEVNGEPTEARIALKKIEGNKNKEATITPLNDTEKDMLENGEVLDILRGRMED